MFLRSVFSRYPIAVVTWLAAAVGLSAADAQRLREARSLYDQRRDAEAQAAYAQLASEDPRLPDAPFHLGLLALRREAWEEAQDFLEAAVALNPESAEYHLQLGNAYGMRAMHGGVFSKLGFARKCRQAYERAVTLDPDHLGARWCLMEYHKQAPGFVGGSIARAHEQADAIERLDPGAGRFARAGVLVADKKYDQAFALYDGVLTDEPPDYAALSQLGQLALQTRRKLDDGIAALQKCLTLTPPPGEPAHLVIHGMAGKLYELKGDKAAARIAYQNALALDPDFEPATTALRQLDQG